MTPAELKAWRESVGLTVERVAALLPCGVRTWKHWEAGTRRPPEFLVRALRDLKREIGRWPRRKAAR